MPVPGSLGHKLTEPPRETPVAGETDVLVVGGGPAGVGAALAVARTACG
jgi:heterodisulfide reductase subunit A-like polyferredoxin